jgi:transcription initiation factor TFIID subunit 3
MSINYARELLKISISQLCSAIGFDTTSQIAIDILVDVCERQFQYVAKQTSSLINDQPNFRDFLFILLENNCENLQQFQDYMKQFKTIQFPNDIIQFPYKKRNQFYLRIPPKDSEQVLERDRDETTEYIYDWLPLFPDRKFFFLLDFYKTKIFFIRRYT